MLNPNTPAGKALIAKLFEPKPADSSSLRPASKKKKKPSDQAQADQDSQGAQDSILQDGSDEDHLVFEKHVIEDNFGPAHLPDAKTPVDLALDIQALLGTGPIGFGALEVASSSTLMTVGGGVIGATALGGGGSAPNPGVNINHAPTIVDTAVYLPKMSKSAPAPAGQVGSLVSGLTQGIYDQNSNDPKGIAITQIDASLGTLYYSLNNGVSWTLATDVSDSNALLLADNANTRVYFRPINDAMGIVPNTVYFRAWDQTTGTNGSRADTTTNGVNSAFSVELESIALNIDTPLLGDYVENGPPIVANANLILPTPINGSFTSAIVQIGGGFADGDVLSVAPSAGISAVYDSAMGRLTLTGTGTLAEYETLLRTVTYRSMSDNPTQFGGVRPLIWQVTDAAENLYENAINQVRIIAQNDAPVLSPPSNPSSSVLNSASFGDAAPGLNSGTLVQQFVTGTVVDPDGSTAKMGIAITRLAPNTVLHFSTDGGKTWGIADNLTATNALHLMADADNKIYLQTLPGFSGNAASAFAFRAWDQTSGVDGLKASTLPAGGTSAYSQEVGGGLPPDFEGPTAVSVEENTPAATVIYDASANGDFNVTYSITGPDAALFSIDPATGHVRFLAAPNFESPQDVGADNIYNFTIRATNPFGAFANLDLAISVTNVNESVVTPAGMDKNYLTSNDTANTWVTYSDGVTYGRNVYASAIGPDTVSAIQISRNGGLTWFDMNRSGAHAVHLFNDVALPGNQTYLFRSIALDGKVSAVTSQQMQVSAWTSAPGATTVGTANVSVATSEANALYGTYNAPTEGVPGQTFSLSAATINAYVNNGNAAQWIHGGATSNTGVGFTLPRQVDHLNLTGPGAVLNLSALRENGFSVDKLHGFEFINMQANGAAQAVVADGISMGAVSTAGWLSNPDLINGYYTMVVRGGTNDALVLSKGGAFDFTHFTSVGTSVSAGNFFSGAEVYNIYRNESTKQYILLEQGVQLSRWQPGLNAAPILLATNSRIINDLGAIATSTQAPLNGQASGVLVSSLVGHIHDADGATVGRGIAITAVNAAGTLYFSTNGGSTWTLASSVSNANALLLASDGDNRVYFRANTPLNAPLSNGITFKAWDRTTGVDGAYANTTTSGGTSAFSVASDTGVFTVIADTTLPVLLSSNPSDNGVLLNLGSNIVLNFSENVVKGSGGLIRILNAAGVVVHSFDITTSSAITGWGTSQLTINPPTNLLAATNYHITIGPNAVADAAGNFYAGINNNTTLNFSTVDSTGGVKPPIVVGVVDGQLGWSVAGIGDVNRDGFADFIVSSPGIDSNFGPESGDSFVVYGNNSGALPSFSNSAIGAVNGFKISNANPIGNLGYDATGIGDINGDGMDDVLVSSGFSAGPVVYVVYGNATGTGADISYDMSGIGPLTAPAGGFAIIGPSSGYFGTSVSGVGDVNNDGYADFVVGSVNTRAAYVVYGGPQNGATLNISSGTIAPSRGYRINMPTTISAIADMVSGAGDFNGDGLADVAIADYQNATVYVPFSNLTGTPPTNLATMPAAQGMRILAGSAHSLDHVASLGDINGDGLSDIGINSAQQTYVVYGRATGGSVTLGSLTPAQGFVITHESPNTQRILESAGDINGDGFSDFIVGNSADDSAYVIYGSAAGTGISLGPTMAASSLGFRITGGAGSLGFDAQGAGDINGDGFNDLLVGSPSAVNAGGNPVGGYAIVFGGTQYVPNAVVGAGEVTGTAAAEAIVGSLGSDTLSGGGGIDRFFAGQGNDTIILTANDVANLVAIANSSTTVLATVDGGGGFDTLQVSMAATNLDLTQIKNVGVTGLKETSRIEGIERIDLGSDAVANTLSINATDVKDMAAFNNFNTSGTSIDGRAWNNVTGSALGANTAYRQVLVDGTAQDTLNIQPDHGFWLNVGQANYTGGPGYTVYQNETTKTQLLVNSNVVVNNNDSGPVAGEAVISLGSLGQLILPVQVEGKWYYFWDRDMSGTQTTGDRMSMDFVEQAFFGNSSGIVMTDSNRTAVINGATVMLPTRGDGLATTGNKAGTAINSASLNNPTYNDLMAIWDAFNGSTTGTSLTGRPAGWASASYLSSTASGVDTHFSFAMNGGSVASTLDTDGTRYVALQVL